MRPKFSRIIAVLIFIGILIFFRFADEIGRDRAPRGRFLVASVIDGDTIELTGGERLRLLGIDSPERGRPFYDSARIALEQLLDGKAVEVAYSNRRRDRYGRLLGYLTLDTLAVNTEMVRRGLAWVYLFEDNLSDSVRVRQLLSAQREAYDRRRGIWAGPRDKEDYYITRKGSLRFHRPWCKRLADDPPHLQMRIESFREALLQGLSPCRECRP